MAKLKVYQAIAELYDRLAIPVIVFLATLCAMHNQLAPALFMAQQLLEAEFMLDGLEDLSGRD